LNFWFFSAPVQIAGFIIIWVRNGLTVACDPETLSRMPDLKNKEINQKLDLKKLELAALLEITQAINNDLPESALYKIYHFTLLAQLHINRLALFVVEDKWECKVCFGTVRDFPQAGLPDAITAIREITPMEQVDVDPIWHTFQTVIPVIHNSTVLAYVFIGNVHPYYTSLGALSFIQTISNILIVAMVNRRLARLRLAQEAMRKEIEIAREVQTMLFPKSLPNDSSIMIHASYVPHSSIGGDYYDCININEDQFLFCVADVSGKGVPASLLMSNFQAGLRTILRQTNDLQKVMTELNHLIYLNAIAEKFITCFVAIYDRKTRELHYVNAGHNAPVLLYEDNSYHLLEEGCTMLGILETLPFLSVTTVQVPPRSLLLAYTDGLTEVFDQEDTEYGLENTIRFLQQNRYVCSSRLHVQLLHELNLFNSQVSFSDDITLLSCRFK
jgi:sigma-B regulation protein RsbU (phosphoserine phosphatase)